MIRRAFRGCATALVVGISFAPIPLIAAPPAEVEDLIKQGNELRRHGKDHEALPLFQRAHELGATPRTSVQLGLVESALGYDVEAEEHLAHGLESRSDHWIGRHGAVVQEELRKVRARLGEVTVVGSPATAEVLINGRPFGHVPTAPIRVPAGTVKVEMRAPGYTDASAVLVVPAGGRERVALNLALVPTTSLAVPTLEPKRPLHAAVPAAPVVPGERKVDSPALTWGPAKVAGAVLLGAGILSVAGGSLFLLLDKQQACELPGMPDAQCDQRRQTRVPGWSLAGGGIAAGALGGILLYRSGSTTVAASATSLHVAGKF